MTAARIPFGPDDESAIRTLTGTMMFLLVVNAIFGGIGILGGCLSFASLPGQLALNPIVPAATVLSGLSILVYCAGMIVQAALLFQTRRALELVVTTDNQDQVLLGQAFAKLRLFFLLEAVLFFVAMVMQCSGFLTQAFSPSALMPGQFGGGF